MKAKKKAAAGPRVLFLDIETAPILGYVWSIWQQNVALNQIRRDWFIMSWAAKWLGDAPADIMYMDQRRAKNMEDDSAILKYIWRLLNEADIVVTQNGKMFDEKKLNARFVMHKMQPPSPYKHVDTLQIAKKRFGFTSNKLEYMTDKLCVKYKKLKHEMFSGFEMWKECLQRNKKAWVEMEKYNKHDVLALEELYLVLRPWDDTSPNYSWYTNDDTHACSCSSTDFNKRGFHYTSVGKFQRYQCVECGAWSRDRVNLFSDRKKEKLLVNVKR